MRPMMPTLLYRHPSRLLVFLSCLLALGFSVAKGQGTARITIAGVPSVLKTPYLAEIQRDYEAGKFPVQLVYSNASRQPAKFKFSLSLELDGEEIVHATSPATSIVPGVYTYRTFSDPPQILFPSLADLITQMPADLQTRIAQTGLLPEGRYQLTLEALPDDPEMLIIAPPASVSFTVSFPEAPVLLAPSDDAVVNLDLPIFTWLPVIIPAGEAVSYQLRIVEVLSGQTVDEAFKGNRPMLESAFQSETRFVYGADQLPLETGHQYAWNVKAKTASGLPISEEGQSEIFTFDYKQGSGPDDVIAALRRVVLEPGLAELDDFAGVTVTDDGTSWLLNGPASLRLMSPYSETAEVELTDLRILKGNLSNPSLSGGALRFQVPEGESFLGTLGGGMVHVRELVWTFGAGFTVEGGLKLPGASDIPASGRLRLTTSGVSGELTAVSEERPVFQLSSNGTTLALNHLVARFPENRVTASGVLGLLGTTCNVPDFTFSGGLQEALVDCQVNQNVRLVPDQDLVTLRMGRLQGQIRFDFNTGQMRPDLSFDGGLQLRTQDGSCSAALSAGFSDQTGLTVRDLRPSCELPRLPLGLLDLALSNLRVPQLAFDPQTNRWQFALDFDAQMTGGLLGNVRLPRMTSLRLTPEGLTLPDLYLTEPDLSGIGEFRVGPMLGKVTALRVPRFSLNPFALAPDAWRPVLMDFAFRMDESVPVPTCLQRPRFAVRDFRFTSASFDLNLGNLTTSACELPLGIARLRINQFGGNMQVGLSESGVRVMPQLALSGGLLFDAPFTCSGASETLVPASIALTENGRLSANIAGLAPTCPVNLGFGSGNISSARLILEDRSGVQVARLEANAGLDLSLFGQSNVQVSGALNLDLMTGRFSDYQLDLTAPLNLPFPTAQNPFLTFNLNGGLRLSPAGLRVAGSHSAQIGGATIPVRFTDGLFDLNTLRFLSGSALIGDAGRGFQLAYLLSEGRFAAYPGGFTLPTSNLFAFNAESVQLTSGGFSFTGETGGRLQFGTQILGTESLRLRFSDFTVGVSPFSVARGSAGFFVDGSRIATFDASGFHLEPGGLLRALPLPAQLPLPDVSLAYLRLRSSELGPLLLDTEDLGGGRMRLFTRSGQPLQLVIPGLASGGTPPAVNASFDLVVDSGSFAVQEIRQFNTALTPSFTSAVFGAAPIQLNALRLAGSGLGLTLFADLQTALPSELSRDPLVIHNLQVTPAGFADAAVSARINLPDGTQGVLRGNLSAGTSGLRGELTLDAPFVLGTSPLQVRLSGLALRFPEGQLTGNGTLALFGGRQTCAVPRFSLGSSGAGGSIDCRLDERIALVPGSDLATLTIGRVTGTIGYRSGAFTHDLTMAAQLGLEVTNGPRCGTALNLRFNASGFSSSDLRPDCSELPRVNLGAMEALFSNLRMPALSFDTVRGQFDFELATDAQLTSSFMGGVALPAVTNLRIRPDGITFPDLNFTAPQLTALRPFDLSGLRARLTSFNLRSFTLDWFRGRLSEGGDWNANLGVDLNLPDDSVLPSCLRSQHFATSLALTGGTLTASLPDTRLAGCTLPIGPSNLNLTQIGGSLRGNYASGRMNLEPSFLIGGTLTLSDAVTCASDRNLSLGTAALRLGLDGRMTGSVSANFPASCSLGFGPFNAELGRTTLSLGTLADAQTALLDGVANLTIGGSAPFAGAYRLNLMSGRLEAFSFGLSSPFSLAIPPEAPVFRFDIASAVLDQNGLSLNGSNTLRLGASSVRADFDHVRLNLSALNLEEGRITIDGGLGLEAGIGAGGSLSFNAVASGAPATLNPGLLMRLGSAVTFDRTGMSLTGRGSAALNYRPEGGSPIALPGLNVDFGTGFTLSLSPFNVTTGRANFLDGTAAIGSVDATGFHLNPGYVVDRILPERLPLPSVGVAYLQLRRDGESLVEATTLPSGALRLNIKRGETIKLVMPALTRGGVTPEVNVNFTDVEVNPATFAVSGGTISADVSRLAEFALPDQFPIQLQNLRYGDQLLDGRLERGLFLNGDFRLLGEAWGSSCPANLIVDQNGRLNGRITCSGLNQAIPLTGSGDLARLLMQSVSGSIDVNLPAVSGGAAPVINFGLGGALELTSSGSAIGRIGLTASYQNGRFSIAATADGRQAGGLPRFTVGPLGIGVTDLRDLRLTLGGTGLQFGIGADLDLSFQMPDGARISIPATGAYFGTDGFRLPAIRLAGRTLADLGIPPIALGPVQIQPTGIQIPSLTLGNLTRFGADLAAQLLPSFDLEFRLPSVSGLSSDLATTRIPFTGVTFQNGVFTGNLGGFTLPGSGITVPFGADAGLQIRQISARFFEDSGRQGVDVRFNGGLQFPAIFGDTSSCAASVAAQLSTTGDILANVSGLAPCGTLRYGPLSLRFTRSDLDLALGAANRAVLDGGVQASLQTASGVLNTTGDITVNLLNGQLTRSELQITEPFAWSLPAENGLLRFNINRATINPTGIMFTGGGTLNVPGAPVGVTFNNAAFGFDGRMSGGSVDFSAPFGFNIPLGEGTTWGLTATNAAPIAGNFFRLNLPSGLRLTTSGLTVNGTSSAILQYGTQTFNDSQLSLNFAGFQLGFSPFGINGGRVDLNTTDGGRQVRVAYFDRDGFHPDNLLAALPLPERLPLPDLNTAFVQLRDSGGSLLVETADEGGGRLVVRTRVGQSVNLVLPALRGTNPSDPTIPAQFEFVLNSGDFSLLELRRFEANGAPALNALLFGASSPLQLQQFDLSGSGATLALRADIRVNLPTSISPTPLEINNIRISQRGFEEAAIHAQLTLPGGTLPADVTGTLRGGAGGLTGELVARADGRASILQLGSNPITVGLTEMRIQFPAVSISGQGGVSLMNGAPTCAVNNFTLSGETNTIGFSCSLGQRVQLVPGSNLATLGVGTLGGDLTFNARTGAFGYNLNAIGDLAMQVEGMAACGASLDLTLSSASGFSARNVRPNCGSSPSLNLGFMNMGLRNLTLPTLNFNPVTGRFNFELALNALLSIPSFNNLQLPELPVRITESGINFSPFSYNAGDLSGLGAFNLGFAEAQLTGLRLAAPFTFNWFTFDGSNGGNWDFAFDMRMRVPNTASLPDCVENAGMDLTNMRFTGSSVSFTSSISAIGGSGCAIPMGPATLNITRLGAQLNGSYRNGSFNLEPTVQAGGNISLAPPFACSGSNSLSLGSANLTITPTGLLDGRIENLAPSCPLQFGSYAANISRADLTFGIRDGVQSVLLDGGASLQFAPGQSVSGSFSLDLASGRFLRYRFDLDNPFDWAVPSENPVFNFRINRASLDETGLLIDGRNNLRLADGVNMGVTFDNFRFDLTRGQVVSGNVTFDSAFGLQAGINTTTNQLTFGAVPLGAPLTLSPGAMLQLTGALRIDRDGLAVNGSAQAAFRYQDWNLTGLRLVYSDDFRFNFTPFGVSAGSMTIEHDGARVATITSGGIAIDPAYVLSVLPDRLPAPHVDVAYLELKRSGTLMVDVQRLPSGNIRLNTQSGRTVDLVLPALRGSGAVPRLPVTFTNFEIDPRDFHVVDGYFTINTSDVSRLVLPANFPLQLTELGYGKRLYNGVPTEALFLTGNIRMFDNNVPACTITTYVQTAGRVVGEAGCRGMNQDIPLVGNSNLAVLQIRDVTGNFDFPLTGGSPTFALNVVGGFRMKTEDAPSAPIAAELDINAQFSETGFRLTGSTPRALSSPPTLDMGIMAMGINQITTLTMAYTGGRFSFRAGLDVRLRFGLEEGQRVELPSYNIEISDRGLQFAALDLHSGSMPPLALDPFNIGPVSLDLLAFRMPAVTVDFFHGGLSGFNPHFDLELQFPGFRAMSPELANARISLNDVGLQDGTFVGNIVPYVPEGGLLRIPLGGSVNLSVTRIEGRLLNAGGAQGFDLQLTSNLQYPNLSGSGPACSNAVTLGFNGTTFTANADVAPCGSLNFDPVSLRFLTARLDLAFGGTTRALFNGSAEATVRREGGSTITATGTLGMNLLTGEISDASIAVTGPFTWQVPTNDPMFSFTVNSALLDRDGITFNGGGNLRVGDGNITVNFNNPHFRFRDMALTSGDILLNAAIAFDLDLGGSPGFRLVSPSSPVPSGNFFRLGLPTNMQITREGITVAGAASAQLRFGSRPEDFFNGLSLNFVGFTMGITPISVQSGRVDVMHTPSGGATTRLAYFDRDGFHPDNLAGILPIPARLGLPSADIAYLQLRSGPSNTDPLLIQTQDVGGGRLRIYTRPGSPVQVVFAGFSGAPSAGVDLDMVVNTADFGVASVNTFNVQISESLNRALFNNFPIAITSFGFSGTGASLAFTASARVTLPESLSSMPLNIENLRITSSGFESVTARIGTYSASYQPACEATPVQQANFSDGAVVIAACGVEVQITSSGVSSLRFSGQLGGTFLQSNTGSRTRLHLAGEVAGGSWNFTASASHLPGARINLGFATLEPTLLSLTANSTEFSVNFNGTFRLPALGNDFAISVEGLRIGTAGVSITSAEMVRPQTFNLFGGALVMNVSRLALLGPSGPAPMRIRTSGTMNVLNQTGISFTDFTIGTDGSVSLGSGEVNFLASRPLTVIPDVFVMNELRLRFETGRFSLRGSGNVTLPAPISRSSTVSLGMTIDPASGVVTVDPTTIGFTFDASGRRNGSPLELTLGDFATIEPTAVSLTIDWQHPASSVFLAAANIYIQNDNSKLIQFGVPTNLAGQYGLRVPFGAGSVDWQITNTPSFTFETDFFRIQLNASTPRTSSGWQLVIGGMAGLKLPGVGSASAAFEGFTIDRTGIVSPGRFTGAFEAQIMSIATLRIGAFRSGSGLMTYTCPSPASTPQDPQTQECSVDTESYLQFGYDASSSAALYLSLGSSFSGGIEKVMYYKTRAGGLYLNIQGVSIRLSGMGSLTASVEYMQEGGDFLLRAAGGGEFTTGPMPVAFGFVGKFANRGGQLSFGLFAYVTVPIPIVPGIVTLTGVGAGFFYRPEDADIQAVLSVTRFTPMRPLPSVEGMSFAVLLAADAGFVGPPTGPYAAQVRLLMMFAAGGPGGAWAISINARGTIFGQSQERVNLGFYLNVTKSSSRSTVAGGVEAVISYPNIIEGSASINFSVVQAEGAETLWAVNGAINNFRIIRIITVNGRFIASNVGFFFDLTSSAGFDFWIVNIRSSFQLQVWWNKTRDIFGAYARIGISASVLGGLAELGATAEGAFIREGSNYLIYAAASGYVKVLFVFKGTIRLWIACQNGSWDGGMGSDARYQQMIEDARNEAAEMESASEEAANALDDAQHGPEVFGLTSEQLVAAGALLQSYPQTWRSQFASEAVTREQNFMNALNVYANPDIPLSSAYSYTVNNVIEAYRADISTAPIETARSSMESRIRQVSSQAPAVVTRLRNATAQAVEWQNQVNELDIALRSPIRNLRLEWDGDTPPNFEIDESIEAQNSERLSEFRAAIAALDQQFQESIAAVSANINKIDDILRGSTSLDLRVVAPAIIWRPSALEKQNSGFTLNGSTGGSSLLGVIKYTAPERSVNEIARVYRDAMQSINEFYALKFSYSWEMREVYQRRMNALNTNLTAMNTALTQLNSGLDAIARLPSFFSGSFASLVTGMYDLTYYRRLQVLRLVYKNENDGEQRAINETNTFRGQLNASNLVPNMSNAGQELWVGIHQRGLNELMTQVPIQVDADYDQFETRLNEMQTGFNEFTQIVDELYAIKADMTTTLFGMLDEYINWRTTTLRTNDNTAWQTRRAELAQLLEPPRITSVSFIPNKPSDKFYNRITFNWAATHPTAVVEYAYSFGDASDGATIATDNAFLTVGSQTSYIHTVAKRNLAQTSQVLAFRVRARGAGGNTISRGVRVTVNVGTGSTYTGSGVTTTSGNLIPADITPPVVEAINVQNAGETSTSDLIPYSLYNPMTGRTTTTYLSQVVRKIWTNQGDRLVLMLDASDPESDVSAMEYAIGTSRTATDVVPWTRLQAVRTRLNNNVTVRSTGTVRSLSLRDGSGYYLHARAINGNGVTGTAQVQAFGVDQTPPTQPGYPISLPFAGSVWVSSTYTPPVYAPIALDATVAYESPRENLISGNGQTPVLSTTWTGGTDVARVGTPSGLRRYRYVLSRDADPDVAESRADTMYATTGLAASVTGTILNYREPFYYHVWAEDYAGNASTPRTFGPYRVQDPTAPSRPIARLRWGDRRLYFTQTSDDPESGIAGYQFAIGSTGAGSTDIKPFRTDGQADLRLPKDQRYTPPSTTSGSGSGGSGFGLLLIFEGGLLGTTGYQPSSIMIPPEMVADGRLIHATVRAVNTSGMVSSTTSSGALRVDTTRPVYGTLSGTYSRDTGNHSINLTGVLDAESGMALVDVQVVNPLNGAILQDWTRVATYSSRPTYAFSPSFTLNRTSDRALSSVDVRIRLTNGVGMQTTATTRVVIPPLMISLVGGGGGFFFGF